MRIYLLLSVIVYGAVTSAAIEDKNEPKFVKKGSKYELYLPESAKKAIDKYKTNLKLLDESVLMSELSDIYKNRKDESPVADLGDFNGDGFNDIVLIGGSKTEQHSLLVLTNGAEWKVQTIQKWDYKDPKKVVNQVEDSKVTGFPHAVRTIPVAKMNFGKSKLSKRDGFLVDTYWGNTIAYYFDGEKVQVYRGQVQ